jgi:hypothetical protein
VVGGGGGSGGLVDGGNVDLVVGNVVGRDGEGGGGGGGGARVVCWDLTSTARRAAGWTPSASRPLASFFLSTRTRRNFTISCCVSWEASKMSRMASPACLSRDNSRWSRTFNGSVPLTGAASPSRPIGFTLWPVRLGLAGRLLAFWADFWGLSTRSGLGPLPAASGKERKVDRKSLCSEKHIKTSHWRVMGRTQLGTYGGSAVCGQLDVNQF